MGTIHEEATKNEGQFNLFAGRCIQLNLDSIKLGSNFKTECRIKCEDCEQIENGESGGVILNNEYREWIGKVVSDRLSEQVKGWD